MSEDRLEKALEAIRNESSTPEQLESARVRVWENLESATVCAEFRLQFHDYLDGRISDNRRLLLEDHLSRCPQCRAQMAGLKGGATVIPMPRRRASVPLRWAAWAAAAALFLGIIYLGRGRIDALLASGGPRATVASVTGELHRVPEGLLKPGSTVGENEVIRTGPGAHAVLRLSDGSLVEVNERTELAVRATWSGRSLRLERGDVIVRAAKQHRGYLRVQTRDTVASVKGTVFAVSAGLSGSLVSVVEGSVAVSQPGVELLLTAGEQAASNPALAESVQSAVSWSPDAETYLAMLASLAKVEKQIAALPSLSLNPQSRLIQYMPQGMVVYGAVPNPGGMISQAMALGDQQSAESPAFGQWWNSASGQGLKQLVARIQSIAPLLGDEIVYGLSASTSGTVPIILTQAQDGKQSELSAALSNLGAGAGGSALPYRLTGTLLAISDSKEHLDWLCDHLGLGAGTPFAAEIASRYGEGAGWFLGIDMDALLSLRSMATAPPGHEQQVKHIFVEQRKSQGIDENELAVAFKGPRSGIASLLASTGSGGAAEYLSTDAIAAIYVSTREPRQLFEELMARLSRSEPSFQSALGQAEAKLGVSFMQDLAGAIGTESAFAVEGLSAAGPVWELAVLVNDSAALDRSIQRLVDIGNAEMEKAGQAGRILLEQDVADGRTWTTMSLPSTKWSISWTYDRGYMVAGSDRATAARAIATRNSGSPLVWSTAFQQQLPPSAGLHPAGFAWLNTRGTLQNFAALAPNPAFQKLIAERDPILVVFGGTTEQIRAISRTQFSGFVMNALLMQGMGLARTDTPQ